MIIPMSRKRKSRRRSPGHPKLPPVPPCPLLREIVHAGYFEFLMEAGENSFAAVPPVSYLIWQPEGTDSPVFYGYSLLDLDLFCAEATPEEAHETLRNLTYAAIRKVGASPNARTILVNCTGSRSLDAHWARFRQFVMAKTMIEANEALQKIEAAKTPVEEIPPVNFAQEDAPTVFLAPVQPHSPPESPVKPEEGVTT